MLLSYALSMQKTGFASVGQGDWTEILSLMRQLGYDGVELSIKNPTDIDFLERL